MLPFYYLKLTILQKGSLIRILITNAKSVAFVHAKPI